MAKVNGVFETSLYVEDLQRSKSFYESLFGFKTEGVSERLIALGVNENQLLLLCKKKGSTQLEKGAHDGEGQLHLAFSIATEDLSAWREVLGRHRIIIEQERSWEYGGQSIYFRDPDGHLIELATPGTWPNY